MTRILITGASGFIGHAVTTLAAERSDWEVHAVISGRRVVEFPASVQVETADLRRPEVCDGLLERVRPDILLHLAWGLEGADFLLNAVNLSWMETSLRLLKKFAEYGGSRFIFSGSSAEYGYAQAFCHEDGSAQLEDLYGTTKLAFNRVAEMFCRMSGVSYTGLRFFSVYGAGERNLLHAVPVALDALYREQVFTCKSPDNLWDYIYIDDAAAATIAVMERDISGIINIASGRPVSMRELFVELAKAAGKPELLHFTAPSGVHPRTLVADVKKLSSEVGFHCQYTLQDGLKKTAEWWSAMSRNEVSNTPPGGVVLLLPNLLPLWGGCR